LHCKYSKILAATLFSIILAVASSSTAVSEDRLILTVSLVVENRTAIVYTDKLSEVGSGTIFGIFLGDKLIAKSRVVDTGPGFAKFYIEEGSSNIVEGAVYGFEIPTLIPETPATQNFTRSRKMLSIPGEVADSPESSEEPEDMKTADKKPAEKKTIASKSKRRSLEKKDDKKEKKKVRSRKSETGKESSKDSKATPKKDELKKAEQKEVSSKKPEPAAKKKKPAVHSPWEITPETWMSNSDGEVGLVLIPIAQNIGHYNFRTSLSYAYEDFSTYYFSGVESSVDVDLRTLSIGYGLTDNITLSYSYNKEAIRIDLPVFDPINSSFLGYGHFSYHSTINTLGLKYTFPGDWPGNAKTAIYTRYENSNFSGNQDDTLTMLGIIDFAINKHGALITANAGVDDPGNANLFLWGLGIELPVTRTLRLSLEHSQSLSDDANNKDNIATAVGIKHRFGRNWSGKFGIIFNEGRFWDSESSCLVFKATYHPPFTPK